MIGVLVALTFGLVAGVAAIRNATTALRTAEREAVATATLLAEGELEPCARATRPVVSCETSGLTATVSVELNGTRATAAAGPEN